ncbi:flavin reductase family protein [Salicibibacter kimchii]|uniref:Flavin reductase n=1 Tax=Salicibibacter kimchii TaxID=2099786 RepID=A0A345C180_9BACI|nr:flavin reductase family protein [Salicibibacter kimchii]AXF56961.1 flavin reductase [Salicibibacter kimchii]
MDTRDLRNCFGRFTTGVTVVTWGENEYDRSGITVNSFTTVSMDPPLILVSIDKGTKAYRNMKGKPFVVNILSADQEALAWQFAGKNQQGLSIQWDQEKYGPILQGALATIECSPWEEFDAGDHVLRVGKVENYHYVDGDGLMFIQGKILNAQEQKIT